MRSRATSLTIVCFKMSSSSLNSSPSHPGLLDSQCFHCIFPTVLPWCQCNILYATVLQQPSLVADLERQSLYEEDNTIQSLICVFHHLCSIQIYLGSFEPHTDHIVSSNLHIVSALDDTLDLLCDHGFHHHVLTLPPYNFTLIQVFQPIYHTLSAVEWDAYEESDLRLVDHISSPMPTVPIPTPHTPSAVSLETPASSLLSTTATLINDPADPCPAFHQNHTTFYPTQVVPWDPHLGLSMAATPETICFHCHTAGHLCINCPDYECPNCQQLAPGHPQYWCLHNYCSFCQCFGHSPTIVQTDNVPSVMTLDTLLQIVPSLRTPAAVSSSTMGTWRGSDHVLVVQVFKGGIVTICGDNILFSIVHLLLLSSNSPYTFTVSIMFFPDDYWYIIW